MVGTLKKLLADAEAGKLTGAVFTAQYSTWYRGIYAIGEFAADPAKAADTVADMARALFGYNERRNGAGMIYRLISDPKTGVRTMPFCSEAATRILGLDPVHLGQDATLIEKLIHPDDMARLFEYSAPIVKAGGLWEQEYRIFRRGRPETVLGRAEVRVLPNGHVQFDGMIMQRQ